MCRMSTGHKLRSRIADELKVAMRARDRTTISALRSVSAAIANAEAVATGPTGSGPVSAGSAHVAGAVGLGAGEVARRELTDDDLAAIVADEASQRETTAETDDANGHAERADTLRQEAAVVRRLISRVGC